MVTDYCFTCGTYTEVDDISYMCEACETAAINVAMVRHEHELVGA
jgi:hypothetical protein